MDAPEGTRIRAPDGASSVGTFYITTAIDYSNGDPHIGHAYEKIGADAIARYRRLCGDAVHFMIGMDEHGQKVAQAAAERGMAPQELADEIAARFNTMWDRLSISRDQFLRTTDPAHKTGVRLLIERIHARTPDAFYERSYEGWYCVGCEQFKRDSEIVGGKCVLHPTRVLEWTEERNWFFRLSRYQEFIRDLLDTRREFLQPESRRNEILALLDQGLEDISITRSKLGWAIPFPLATSAGEHQGTWVWFDALPNYLTGTGFPRPGYERRWPAQLHVVGKDITRLHAVIWPAMLHAAELPLPERIWAHGFVLLAGERFSKSAGVKLDLDEAIDRYGADAFRYFLLREVPFDADGTFSWERFEERYSADLSNGLGNLASRTVAMIQKYRGGVVPAGDGSAVAEVGIAPVQSYHHAMEGARGYLLHEALKSLWRSISQGNEFVQLKAPWALAKDPSARAELDDTLCSLAGRLARLAVCLYPFMPAKAQALWSMLGGPDDVGEQRFEWLEELDPAGWRVTKGEALFPRAGAVPIT